MPPITVTQLLTPITQAQFFATFQNALVTLGIPATQWRSGGVASTMLQALASTCASFSTLMTSALASMFLDYATGSWLVLLAYYVYGVNAIPATFASGFVTLTNSGGGVYTYAANTFTILNTTTKQTYVVTQPFTLGALSSLTVSVSATTSGSAGSAAPGQINALVTVALGVTVTNGLSVVGQDAQSDADLRATCRAALGGLSVRGPRNAYTWAVKTALNAGVPVNINRISVSSASSNGIVTVYCASPSGVPVAGDLTAAAANIEAAVRPNAVTAYTYAATPVTYGPTVTIYATAIPGLTAAAVQAGAAAALAAQLSLYPIGGMAGGSVPFGYSGQVYASWVDGVIYGSNSAIFDIEGSTNLPLHLGEVATDAISLVVVMVPA